MGSRGEEGSVISDKKMTEFMDSHCVLVATITMFAMSPSDVTECHIINLTDQAGSLLCRDLYFLRSQSAGVGL